MKLIENQCFDAERSLYGLRDTRVAGCTFAGPADGESVLKECHDVQVEDCSFSLRYPMWHDKRFVLRGARMDELTRAALWYADDGVIENSVLGGIKALRECNRVVLKNCDIESPEFGWKCGDITLEDSSVTAEYLFLDSRDITLRRVRMKGKYSFQYVQGLTIEDSVLDTKDAFWHAKHVTMRNCEVRGEYLGWFSEGLTLIDCRISGTQPLCYCKDLKLVNCTMEGTDLSFEYSQVEADVRGHIDSVKNPASGTILCDSVGEIIREDPVMECTGEVILRG